MKTLLFSLVLFAQTTLCWAAGSGCWGHEKRDLLIRKFEDRLSTPNGPRVATTVYSVVAGGEMCDFGKVRALEGDRRFCIGRPDAERLFVGVTTISDPSGTKPPYELHRSASAA